MNTFVLIVTFAAATDFIGGSRTECIDSFDDYQACALAGRTLCDTEEPFAQTGVAWGIGNAPLTTIAAAATLLLRGRMIKSQLVLRVGAQNRHLYNRDIEKAVKAIFSEIEAALVRRDRVELRGFGVLTVKTWPARPGRNPKTGATISVPETHHPSFRISRKMHARLNSTAVNRV